MNGGKLAALMTAATVATTLLAALTRSEGAAAPLRPAKESAAVLAFRWDDGQARWELTRVEARSLEPVPGAAVGLGRLGTPSWAFSPDRRLLAMAPQGGTETRRISSLRIVDAEALRKVLELPLGEGFVSYLAWLEPDRLLAVLQRAASTQLVTVAPSGKRVLSRRTLDGQVVGAGHSTRALALLVAPEERIGPARLAVVYAGGDFRTVSLERVWAGVEQGERADGEYGVNWRRPGFAVDPERGRALVFPAGGDAAEIDLGTLAVGYHAVVEPVSALRRLARWLGPTAEAKLVDGPARSARWLGDGLVALAGADYASWRDGDGNWHSKSTPAGLSLVDARTWTARSLDRGADAVAFADGLLLATGASWESESEGTRASIGLSAYGMDGKRRFRVLDDEAVWLYQAFDGLAYVGGGAGQTLRIVDLATGRVVGERGQAMPWIVRGEASAFAG